MQPVKRIGRALAEAVFPSRMRCVVCGQETILLPERAICFDCEPDLPYDTRPGLGREGLPFGAMAAAFYYSGAIPKLIHEFKYRDGQYLKDVLGYYLYDRLKELDWHFDVIVPVPIHKSRRRLRGYNQSELLGKALAQRTGHAVAPRALQRVLATQPQVELDSEQRQANMQGAFQAQDTASIQGKSVLLIDDVFTTGSTAAECAKTLLDAGAQLVYALCVAVDD